MVARLYAGPDPVHDEVATEETWTIVGANQPDAYGQILLKGANGELFVNNDRLDAWPPGETVRMKLAVKPDGTRRILDIVMVE